MVMVDEKISKMVEELYSLCYDNKISIALTVSPVNGINKTLIVEHDNQTLEMTYIQGLMRTMIANAKIHGYKEEYGTV
jgi:hypothetical protein